MSEKGQIHHLNLAEGNLSRETCAHIRSLLSNEQCALKTLTLRQRSISSPDEVIDGLANNQSVKCLNLCGDLTTHFMDSPHRQQFSAIEKIELYGYVTPFPNLHEFSHQLTNVKSLKITGSLAKETIHAVRPSPVSSLRELVVRGVENKEVLQELSSFISNNTTLKVLGVSGSNRLLPSSVWVNFFNAIKHAKHLESICVLEVITNDAVMASFSDWIASTQTLKKLEVVYCRWVDITPVGWQSFATALASLDKLEDISNHFLEGEIDNDPTVLVLNAFISKPNVQRVTFSVEVFAQLQLIANVVGSPSCNITELAMIFHNQQTNWETEQDQVTQTLVDSLQRNTSLRTLSLRSSDEDYDEWLVPFHWPLVSNLLCSTSSIDGTAQSNHTLESISVYYEAPIDIISILHMNRNTNKRDVIREKILRNHQLDQVNFVPASLPKVFSWLGAADVDQKLSLSQFYGILRTMPHLIQKQDNCGRGLKRKELQGDGK
jgi:hypothetical protein